MVMNAFQISPYTCTFIAAFAVSFLIVFLLLRKRGVPGRYIGYSMFLNVILTLYGAKMYSMITGGFRTNLLNAGISSLGGAIGLLTGIFIFGYIYKEGRSLMWECYVLVLPLMYGISKIGCYLVGCCHGIPYTGPLAVTYQNQHIQGGPYFPIQLLESILFVVIFLIGVSINMSAKKEYTVPGIMILCAVAKFAQEYLREEHVRKVISANQWVCLGFFLWGMIWLLQKKLHRSEFRIKWF